MSRRGSPLPICQMTYSSAPTTRSRFTASFYLAADVELTEIISITSPVLGSILRTGDAAPRLPYKKRSAGVARVAETPIPLTRGFRPRHEWVFRSS